MTRQERRGLSRRGYQTVLRAPENELGQAGSGGGGDVNNPGASPPPPPPIPPAPIRQIQQAQQANNAVQEHQNRIAAFESRLAAAPPQQQQISAQPGPVQITPEALQQALAPFQSQMASLQAQLQASEARRRAAELVSYRSVAVRESGVDPLFESLVSGSSEEEIDQSVEYAKKFGSYARDQIKREVEAQIRQELGSIPQQIVPVVQQPPASPHYVPAYGQQQSLQQGAGFPTAPNESAPPVDSPHNPVNVSIADVTSEDAVRTGKYGGKLREEMLGLVRKFGAGTTTMGTLPLHIQRQMGTSTPPAVAPPPPQQFNQQQQQPPPRPQVMQQMPQQQPWQQAPQQQQWAPPPPVAAPQQQQQQQQVVESPTGLAGSPPAGLLDNSQQAQQAAQAAIQKMRSGQAGGPMTREAAKNANEFAQKRGVDAASTFRDRFAPST